MNCTSTWNLQRINTASTRLLHMPYPNLVITEPADGLAHNSARPSASTMMTTTLYVLFQNFLWPCNTFLLIKQHYSILPTGPNEVSWQLRLISVIPWICMDLSKKIQGHLVPLRYSLHIHQSISFHQGNTGSTTQGRPHKNDLPNSFCWTQHINRVV